MACVEVSHAAEARDPRALAPRRANPPSSMWSTRAPIRTAKRLAVHPHPGGTHRAGSYRSHAAANELNGRPGDRGTSRARTVRRTFPGSIRAAATGSVVGQAPVHRARARGRRPPLPGRSRVRASVPGNSRSSTTARKYRPDPPTSSGRAPASAMSSTASGPRAWNARHRERARDGSARSSRWCGTARSLGAWASPCRRPCLDTRASSRSRRSRRRDLGERRASGLGLADGRGSDERERRGAAPQTATALRRRHQLAGQVVRRGLGDPRVDERARLQRVGADARSGSSGSGPAWTAPACPAPSTSTSNVAPTCARAVRARSRSCSSTSRSNRSCTTSFGTWSRIDAARVPGRGRVLERVGAVEPRPLHDIERVGEVLLGLPGEPDDDVGRHGDVGDRVADARRATRGSDRGGRSAASPSGHRSEPDCNGKWMCSQTLVALGHRLDHVRA